MNFSKIKYLGLGLALASSVNASQIAEQPNIGRVSNDLTTIEPSSCHIIPIYATHLILERLDDSGNHIGYSYHLVKKENEEKIVDMTVRRLISEGNVEKLLGEFETNPFVFVTKDKIYTNWMSRENPNFSEKDNYGKKRDVCKDINKILREERIKETRPEKKEIS
ncbi:MAG: hypothetical protein AABX93_02825 [Nanoarchaeota archaeon]